MPLPPKLKKAIRKFEKKDGKMSQKFYPYDEVKGDLKLYVLAIGGRDRKYSLLGTVDKWGVEFDKFRDRTTFSVSTIREDFGPNQNETFFEIIRRATHLAKNGEIYSIRQGDTVQAFYLDFGYKVYGWLEAQLSFSLDDTLPE